LTVGFPSSIDHEITGKHMRRIRLLAVAALVGVSPLAAQDPARPALLAPVTLTAADSAHYLQLGRTYVRMMLTGKADSLAMALDSLALTRVGGVAGIADQQAQMADRVGAQAKILDEKLTRRNGALQYWQSGEFTGFTDEPVVIRVVFNEHGKVIGMGINPMSKAPPVD
jgi:hypothetical protein